jgi:hypothetical protein
MKELVIIQIREGSSPLRPTELAEFLFLFRATILGLKNCVPQSVLSQPPTEPTATELKEYARQLAKFRPSDLNQLFSREYQPDAVEIKAISMNSPLEITICGTAVLLCIGVILSGGKFKMNQTGVSAELPPLASGIKGLLEALGLYKQINTSYGVSQKEVKLNKQEFNLLMQPATGSGGFQSFLLGLQARVNKLTRVLLLSADDLDRIYKYKAQAQKGGFQARLKKIFQRHFPDDRRR